MMTEDIFTSLMVLAYVLVVMSAIVLAITGLGKIADRRVKEPVKELDTDEVSPEIIAVLAAAATEMLGRPIAIHSARLHRDADHPTWASAGRIDIMLSHRVGPRR